MTTAWVAIGGNIEPELRMPQAARLLRGCFPDARFSRCYRNPAFGFEGADFWNAAAGFDTRLELAALVDTLRSIEEQCGRRRSDPQWAPRVMDIDLLVFDGLTGRIGKVTLPHPDLLRRAYVLGPMADLLPQWRHPLDGRTLISLWHELEPVAPSLTDTGIDLNAL
jgi:2-amino-4-hydroxy-6-hydroxymethyldihydropteridine diphosphokinase